MRLLLDTHALIWWWIADNALPERARAAIADPDAEVFVSAATGWEIATKVRKGQLPQMRRRVPTFCEDVVADHFRHLHVRAEHGVRGGSLVGDHKDPFDRLIAAQALIEELTVVTGDREFAKFGCKVLW